MKLTPRQIEVLTEKFDGTEPDWRGMTAAQRNGRRRVLEDMRAYDPKRGCIESRSGEITLLGLMSLEPHYADRPKIAAAIEARRRLEAEREVAAEAEKRKRKEENRRRIADRNAKLIEGYRRILADHHFDVSGTPDDVILSVGNSIYEFEGRV